MVVILEPGIKIKRLIAFETLKKPKLPLRNIINTTQYFTYACCFLNSILIYVPSVFLIMCM
jgi:hypothetical protein